MQINAFLIVYIYIFIILLYLIYILIVCKLIYKTDYMQTIFRVTKKYISSSLLLPIKLRTQKTVIYKHINSQLFFQLKNLTVSFSWSATIIYIVYP